jgi:hypothetical protein
VRGEASEYAGSSTPRSGRMLLQGRGGETVAGLTRIVRLVLALPLYALSYLLFIPLFVAGCVLAAVIGVVFMALLVPLVVVLLIVGLFRRGAFGDFFDWLGEHNPVSVLMLLAPMQWVWQLGDRVAGRAS